MGPIWVVAPQEKSRSIDRILSFFKHKVLWYIFSLSLKIQSYYKVGQCRTELLLTRAFVQKKMTADSLNGLGVVIKTS
jgi:hypothetical protein